MSSAEAPRPGFLRGREALRDALPALIAGAQRELAVFAPQVESFYFNTAAFVESLTTMVLKHRENRLRWLTEDPVKMLRENDRLSEALRHLTDRVELRALSENDTGRAEFFVLADRHAYFVQPDLGMLEARVGETRRELAERRETFDALWARGTPASLRPLGL